MSILLHGDCLEELKGIDDKSIDLIFCDLPYGQTSCKWDCKIDLDKFWIEIMRIKKLNTPIFFTTTTKFGVDLINSAPKKCYFRYDIVWVKSAPAGFLSAKKMPMRKHEMVYVFYEKLPFYDLSSHTHKFIKEKKVEHNTIYGGVKVNNIEGNEREPRYDPPLPTSVIKEKNPAESKMVMNENGIYGDIKTEDSKECGGHQTRYDPPLPTSVIKDGLVEGQTLGDKGNECYGKFSYYNNGVKGYDPPLPTSIVKEDKHTLYGDIKEKGIPHTTTYDPPLPTSMLEIKTTRGKHSTEKPVALMEWVLKYYSKEGDTVLDPTMGSGSTGVACKNMNRNFIGIEKDPEIYEVAVNRIEN